MAPNMAPKSWDFALELLRVTKDDDAIPRLSSNKMLSLEGKVWAFENAWDLRLLVRVLPFTMAPYPMKCIYFSFSLSLKGPLILRLSPLTRILDLELGT